MDIYGIKNIKEEDLKFEFDKYYKQTAIKLKSTKEEEERNKIRKESQENLSSSNNIEIDLKKLREDFIKLILDENSSKYLWILYSKYNGEENYIDKISEILKKKTPSFEEVQIHIK